MIILFSITLIVIGILNIVILRSRIDRLSIFNKVDTKPDVSFIQQISLRRKDPHKVTFSEIIALWFLDFYMVLFKTATRSQRLKTSTVLVVGIIAIIWLNNSYLELSNKVVIPVTFFSLLIMLFIQAKKRLKTEFEDIFPEALSILIGIISSGNSIAQGIYECSIKTEGIVARVFREISIRLEIGEDSDKVLLDSYRYLPFREYYFFILTLTVNLQSGGEIKEILYRLSKMITNIRTMERARDSKTAEVRVSMKFLISMPFLFMLLLYFISPENLDFLLYDHIGIWVLYYVLTSITVGWLIIRRMINKII